MAGPVAGSRRCSWARRRGCGRWGWRCSWRWPSVCRRRSGRAACGSWTRWRAIADARRGSLMRWLNQVVQITLINLSNLPQRIGTSLVVIIGIAGVVGVLVSVLAMAEGFRHTLSSTGRPDRVIMLRAGSDAEMSSGIPRDQVPLLASLPGIARDAGGQPLASAELVVMVDLPRHGQTDPNNVPFRGVQPAALSIRDEVRIVEGRPFARGVRE